MPGATIEAELERHVQFGEFGYPVYVRSSPTAWAELTELTAGLEPTPDRFVLVTDGGVPAAAVRTVRESLDATGREVTMIRASAREVDKNLAGVMALADTAIGDKITRRSVVVGLGGGLVCNVSGLLAALTFRGIRVVYLPTTFLAAFDGTLSRKVAVNSRVGKNHLGTFWTPELVWTHLSFMATLPPDELRAGLCEGIKNVMTITPERYDEWAARLRPDASYTDQELLWFGDQCITAKQIVMAGDPDEKGPAVRLEYGHTIGHLAELLTGMPHGLAVGVGCLVAARIAARLGFLDAGVEEATQKLLERNDAPTMFYRGFTVEGARRGIGRDNKRGYLDPRDGYADMVLLSRPGHALESPVNSVKFKKIPLVQVPMDAVLDGVQSRLTL
jgi:3-dehydroquinate synthase/2-deoxy-scyllo-inosose synthase